MKYQAILLTVLLSASILIAGGNIQPPQEESSTTVSPLLSSSSTSKPNLTKVAVVEGVSNPKDFVYFERETGLLWQDEAYTDDEIAAFKREHSNQKAGNFAHAKQYCESLDYAGFVDWRLPTSDELTGVYGKYSKVFIHGQENDFWSSTPTTRDRYYVVFPMDAIRYARSARQSNFIRCVRKNMP